MTSVATVFTGGVAPEPTAAPTPIRRLLTRFRHNTAAMVGLTWLVLLVIVAIAAPLVAPQSPTAIHLNEVNANPSWSHLLGTDSVGRDILSRLIFSARVSM